MAKKKPDDESMDAPVRVKLDDAAVAERGRALAEKLGIVKGLREEKKEHADRLAKEIEDSLDECEELRLEILDGAAEKRQGDLFVHEVVGAPDPDLGHVGRVTDDTAKEVLAKVAKKADEVAGPKRKHGAMEPAPGDVAAADEGGS